MLTIAFHDSIVCVNPYLWDWELLFTRGECKLKYYFIALIYRGFMYYIFVRHICRLLHFCFSNWWRFKFIEKKIWLELFVAFTSVAQSCLTLQPHEPQHARPPGPSPTAGVYSNSCPLRRWCHPTISSFVVPFSSCPQSFPASGSFSVS